MKSYFHVMVLMLTASAATTAWGQDRSFQDRSFTDKYGILTESSIFSRTRQPSFIDTRRRGGGGPRGELVLTGVDQPSRNSGFVAFIEDTGSGVTTRVQVGQSFGQGKVTGIGLDSVEYTVAGRTTHVEVGKTLDGTVPDSSMFAAGPTTAPSASTPAGADSASPAPPAAPSSGGGDVLERMRQRRQQELKH